MTNEPKRKYAILFSLLGIIAIGGLGHFYLRRFKEGFVFVIIGIIIEAYVDILVPIASWLEFDAVEFTDSFFVYYLLVVFVYVSVLLIHIIYITKKQPVVKE